MTKFLDDQRVSNMFVKNNEWLKSQNVSFEQICRTDPPPPPQAHTEQVNAVFTRSGKSNDSPKIQKDPPPPIIVNNKSKKDRPIKTTKKDYHMVKTNEYPFCEYIPKTPYPQRLNVDHSHLKRIVKFDKFDVHGPVCFLLEFCIQKEYFELCGCVRWKPSRGYNSSTRDTEMFKGLLHALNATVLL
ncbi:hypothetical protein Tco_0992636 [Tanacetum coccineum]|uniref:Uncharacterized protein n=1 Tax=Tanacetum coccineum TaxID=301880 RepID=A0ABQ5F4D7_9ASTR